MPQIIRKITIHVTVHHRHYQVGITISSVTCCVISLSFPGYEAVAVIISTVTNVLWAWERTND